MKAFLFLCFISCVFEIGNGRIASDFIIQKKPKNTSASVNHLSTAQDVTISIMIHLDSILTSRLATEHGSKTRRRLKIISNEILREVERFFFHPTLNQTIKFKLKDTRFLKNRTEVVRMDENGSVYLKSYCDWQSQKKVANNWYYSVLLTGLDLFYVNSAGSKIWQSTGRGYMGGMCSIKKSCTLLEWHPKNIGFLLAHEIAHSLGISHDGPPYNQCNGQRTVMGSRYDPVKYPRVWSPCSRYALKRYLTSDKSSCLKHTTTNKIASYILNNKT